MRLDPPDESPGVVCVGDEALLIVLRECHPADAPFELRHSIAARCPPTTSTPLTAWPGTTHRCSSRSCPFVDGTVDG